MAAVLSLESHWSLMPHRQPLGLGRPELHRTVRRGSSLCTCTDGSPMGTDGSPMGGLVSPASATSGAGGRGEGCLQEPHGRPRRREHEATVRVDGRLERSLRSNNRENVTQCVCLCI